MKREKRLNISRFLCQSHQNIALLRRATRGKGLMFGYGNEERQTIRLDNVANTPESVELP